MNTKEISARLAEITKRTAIPDEGYGIECAASPEDTRFLISTLREALKKQEEAEAIIRLAVGSITPYEGTNGLAALEASVAYYNRYLK